MRWHAAACPQWRTWGLTGHPAAENICSAWSPLVLPPGASNRHGSPGLHPPAGQPLRGCCGRPGWGAWLLDTNRHGSDEAGPRSATIRHSAKSDQRGTLGELSVTGLGRCSSAPPAPGSRPPSPPGRPAGRRLPAAQARPGPGLLRARQVPDRRPAGAAPVAAASRRSGCGWPAPPEQVRAGIVVADGRLWLASPPLSPSRTMTWTGSVAGVDLGSSPDAVVTETAGGAGVGRARRADSSLQLDGQQSRQAKAARRVPRPGQRGSRRWRRVGLGASGRACHRRRVHQASIRRPSR